MRERGASCRGGLNGWLAGTSGALPEALDLRRLEEQQSAAGAHIGGPGFL